MDDAIHWAYFHALRLVEMAHALGAKRRVYDIDGFTLGDRAVGAFGFTDITIDALVGDEQGHVGVLEI